MKGAITVDKMNSNGEIKAITFHFKDFPYDISTGCLLSSKNIDKDYEGAKHSVYQVNNDYWGGYWVEEIDLCDRNSPFAGEIQSLKDSIARSAYITSLAGFCTGRGVLQFNELAKENTTTAITFYPKVIDNDTCTVIEYIGLTSTSLGDYYQKPTNVIGLFMPLNETKEGCDKFLILVSGNQMGDWLDSVNVSKVK